jgi:hypothetical protein
MDKEPQDNQVRLIDTLAIISIIVWLTSIAVWLSRNRRIQI